MRLGIAQNQTEKFDEALQSFETASLLQPQNIDAMYFQGLTLVAQNNYQGALRAFRYVLERDGNNSFAQYAINLTQARLNATA